MTTFQVKTTRRDDMVDITRQVSQAVQDSGIKDGLCTIFIPHTTAGITINENADPDVVRDMIKALDKMVPWNDDYRHFEGNSAAHIKSSMMGFSQQVIVEGGQLVLGTWQGIYLCDYDGPRLRKVIVKTLGNK